MTDIEKIDMDKIDFKELRNIMKIINEIDELEDKMQLAGVKKKAMVENFLETIEVLDSEGINYPDEAIHFYNKIVEGEDMTEEEKKGTKKKTETKKKDVKKKTETKKKDTKKKTETEKDEFGCVVGTKSHKFCMAIKKKPMTMNQVKKLAWNDTGATYYDLFNKLKEKGFMDVDEDKKIYFVELNQWNN